MRAAELVISKTNVVVSHAGLRLPGEMSVPVGAAGLTLFAHGSGSSRHSPRNQFVAQVLHQYGIGTLLFDLLTEAEGREDATTAQLRFNVSLLAERLVMVTRWLGQQDTVHHLPLAYFGASTGAAAALVAAAKFGDQIRAVVSRGGRPDLAGDFLPLVQSPTLLIIGGNDTAVIELNEQAQARLTCENSLMIVPGATHLFEEPGTLERAAGLAAEFIWKHLAADRTVTSGKPF